MIAQLAENLKGFRARKPFLSAALFTWLCFTIVLCITRITLIADDFNYFSKLYSDQGFSVWDLRPFVARVPLAVLLTKVYFYLPGAEQMKVPAILTSFIFCFSTARIFSYSNSKVPQALDSRLAFWATVVFLLYPTHYEILYWLTAMPYIVGLALWAFSLGTPAALQILLLAAAFLNSEMFVLPALALPPLISLARNELRFTKSDVKREAYEVAKWAAALAICMIIRQLIQRFYGLTSFAYVVSLSIPFVIGRLRDTFYQVYSLHFFKVLWANTAIYWIALLSMVALVIKRKLLSPQKLALLWVLTFLSTAIYWVFDRNAPRALFGAQIIVCLFVFYVVTRLDFKTAKNFLIVFALVFIAANVKIFLTKSQNQNVLDRMEVTWSEKLRACSDPCVFEVRKLDDGIHGDWVMTYNSWPDYIRYIQSKYQIRKTLVPTFIESTGD